MAKTLDFNSLSRPTLELIMRNDARTKLRLTCPTEALVERLETGMGEVKEVLAQKDAAAIRASFTLAAELMSCNDTYTAVTAEQLRDEYRFGIEELIAFFVRYSEFIDEIKNAKN
ncbi:MAG: hypothetical protein IJ042_03360 [Butyricicoccus sp.]|nr:hypothetical protein [Butyricicoccus sp.]